MSASASTSRILRKSAAKTAVGESAKTESQAWVGVDFAHAQRSRPSRALLPLLVLGLLVGLAIASLRIDLIRTRYALAAATAEEKKLIADQHDLIVRKRKLVDPVGLANLARERGFRPAEFARVVVDPMPTQSHFAPNRPTNSLPHVAAPPPGHNVSELDSSLPLVEAP